MEARQTNIFFPSSKNETVNVTERVPIDTHFPEKKVNQLATIESYNKHLFRPNTYLHKWWARRSGTTFRYILKQLVPDNAKRDYYSAGGLEGLNILDPMMGGATTLHEAIRLGANVIGFDIDPIPVLQAQATLSDINQHEKESIFKHYYEYLKDHLNKYYITKCPKCAEFSEIQFTLYGVRKLHESEELLVIDSDVIRVERNDEKIKLSDFIINSEIVFENKKYKVIDKLLAKQKGINGYKSDIINKLFYKRYIPLLIIGSCNNHGKFYKILDTDDNDRYYQAEKYIKRYKFDYLDIFNIKSGPKSIDLIKRNIKTYYELFSPRQLIYLFKSKEYLNQIDEKHSHWLSLLISTSLDFNSMLCGYKGAEKRRPGAIRHVFSHHAYSFPYTSLENNPLFSGNSSGTLGRLFRTRILSASEWANAPIERKFVSDKWAKVAILNESDFGLQYLKIDDFYNKQKCFIVKQNDSTKIPLPNESIDFVVTDPPYYNSVQYSDLSNFFRCWLSWFLPNFADWDYLVTSSAVAENNESQNKFGDILSKIWSECHRVLKRPHGRLIFTYHHWDPNAWIQMSLSLIKAQFRLVNSYIVHSENPISVHIMNLNSLIHDSILILKPSENNTEKKWTKPLSISKENSYTFSKSCADLLGWILENLTNKEDIQDIWESYLVS